MAVIYTLGHSNHPLDNLITLLHRHDIKVVADVRSSAWSTRYPQYTAQSLCEALEKSGIAYLAFEALGGKPRDPALYQANGHPDYCRIAASQPFLKGLDRLIAIAESRRTVILCAEADPAECHRERLIAPELRNRGHEVRHILSDGTLSEPAGQMTLF